MPDGGLSSFYNETNMAQCHFQLGLSCIQIIDRCAVWEEPVKINEILRCCIQSLKIYKVENSNSKRICINPFSLCAMNQPLHVLAALYWMVFADWMTDLLNLYNFIFGMDNFTGEIIFSPSWFPALNSAVIKNWKRTKTLYVKTNL